MLGVRRGDNSKGFCAGADMEELKALGDGDLEADSVVPDARPHDRLQLGRHEHRLTQPNTRSPLHGAKPTPPRLGAGEEAGSRPTLRECRRQRRQALPTGRTVKPGVPGGDGQFLRGQHERRRQV